MYSFDKHVSITKSRNHPTRDCLVLCVAVWCYCLLCICRLNGKSTRGWEMDCSQPTDQATVFGCQQKLCVTFFAWSIRYSVVWFGFRFSFGIVQCSSSVYAVRRFTCYPSVLLISGVGFRVLKVTGNETVGIFRLVVARCNWNPFCLICACICLHREIERRKARGTVREKEIEGVGRREIRGVDNNNCASDLCLRRIFGLWHV